MHCFQEKKPNINYFDFQIKEELTNKEITKITVWILLRCFPFTHFSLTTWSTLKGGRHFCFENPAKSLGPQIVLGLSSLSRNECSGLFFPLKNLLTEIKDIFTLNGKFHPCVTKIESYVRSVF